MPVDSPAVTVLIADDDEDIRTLVRAVLVDAGLDVVAEAIDGEETLAAVTRLDPPPIPAVIVLDNRMPRMTGLDVAARILERLPTQRIILFSAFLTKEIKQQAQELGISACASKNDIARLPNLIAELAAR